LFKNTSPPHPAHHLLSLSRVLFLASGERAVIRRSQRDGGKRNREGVGEVV